MGLNIRGFKAKTSDLREIHEVMYKVSKGYEKRFFLEHFQEWIRTTPGKRTPQTYSFGRIYNLVEEFSQQNPDIIQILEERGLQLYPLGTFTYGWIYGHGYEDIEHALYEKSLIEDFSYWDNDDPPISTPDRENKTYPIDKKEWDKRRKIWTDLDVGNPRTMYMTSPAAIRHGRDIVTFNLIEIIKIAYDNSEEWVDQLSETDEEKGIDAYRLITHAVLSNKKNAEDEEPSAEIKKIESEPESDQEPEQTLKYYRRLKLIDKGNQKGKLPIYECPNCRKRFFGNVPPKSHTVMECNFDGARVEIHFAGGIGVTTTRAKDNVVTFTEFSIEPSEIPPGRFWATSIKIVERPLGEEARKQNMSRGYRSTINS